MKPDMRSVEWRLRVHEDESTSMAPWLDGRFVEWAPLPGSQEIFLQSPILETLLAGNRGGGKCIDVLCDVLTDSGWKQAGQVKISDRLVSRDGTFTGLRGVYPQGVKQCYRMTFCDGASVVVSGEHRWLVQDASRSKKHSWMVRSVDELRARKGTYYIPLLSAFAPGAHRWCGPDPYTLGLILGDGTLGSRYVTVYGHSGDDEIKQHLREQGFTVKQYRPKCFMAYHTSAQGGEKWRAVLGRCVGDAKRVPDAMLMSDPATRLALLQGLMDADGSIDVGGRCSFCTVAEGLRDAVVELARSLGGKASFKWKPKASMPRGGYWHVCVIPCGKFIPFRLSRKVSRIKRMKGTRRRIVSIAAVGSRETVCFAVEHPSHLFVVGREYIVTHNTEVLLADYAQHVGKGFGAAWKGVLFRKSYPELGDIVDKSTRLFSAIWPSAKFNKQDMTWTFPLGEKLLLRHMKVDSDYLAYHGHAYPWQGWEELTTWASDSCYRRMISCCRGTVPGMPRKIRATTNPYGPGFNWVKARWRLPIAAGRTVGDLIRDPDTGDRIAIQSDLRENLVLQHADPDYIKRLREAARNPAELEAWIAGSWDITAGGMFDDLWIVARDSAVVPPFSVPASWRIDRSFDWGSSKPFSVGWWAESDGTELQFPDGRRMQTVRGDLFRIGEWYGWNGEPNKGRPMLATDISRGIIEREIKWGIAGRVKRGIADASIFDEVNGNSIARDMSLPVMIDGSNRPGVTFDPADKSSGSRIQGWEQVRKRLAGVMPDKPGMPREKPGLFVTRECTHFLRTIPSLPRDDKNLDDVDTDAEDHVADEVRYRVRREVRKAVSTETTGLV